jgi:hypothetical protein
MGQSTDHKVQDFINEIMLADEKGHLILEELRRIVFEIYPDVKEKFMYGGIIFSNTDDFSGVFVYKNHVSLEFSRGFEFEDPDKLLEGKGKFRRHLKLKYPADVVSKKVKYFVKQSQLHID